ncbi:MAG: GNAT family N-acetyltransferase [Rhizobiaceae bacterium]
MKRGIELTTARLLIRHWTVSDQDRNAMHRLTSDEQVMRYFPFRRTRAESDALLGKVMELTDEFGMGWAAVCLKGTSEPIGFSGVAPVNYFQSAFTPCVEIGWRLVPEHWGKGYASEAAAALLAHGFRDLGLEKIVAFAVPANTASIAVMHRIGMQPNPAFDFMHPNIPDTHPHLKQHVFFEKSNPKEKGGT